MTLHPTDVARAQQREVSIAPGTCECGQKLKWEYVRMDSGNGTPILKHWEIATCSRCILIWHHELPLPGTHH